MNNRRNLLTPAKQVRSILIALVIALSLVASPSNGLAYSSESVQTREFQASDDVRTIDDRFAEIAQQAPGFGGMFYDESGQLTMYMLESEPGVQQKAEVAMATLLGDEAQVTEAGANSCHSRPIWFLTAQGVARVHAGKRAGDSRGDPLGYRRGQQPTPRRSSNAGGVGIGGAAASRARYPA